ncbi:MAG: hypothetical protein AAF414_12320, partial [Pseudomonadota bacterium]
MTDIATHKIGGSADDEAALFKRRRRNKILGLTLPGTVWLLIFFAVPMFFVLRASFNSFVDAQVIDDFTFANYGRVFS